METGRAALAEHVPPPHKHHEGNAEHPDHEQGVIVEVADHDDADEHHRAE
jgi:hypothetical protein